MERLSEQDGLIREMYEEELIKLRNEEGVGLVFQGQI